MRQSTGNVETVSELIKQGKTLVLAGDEAVMDQLPAGNWIGGTIPYLMSEDGGVTTKDLIAVSDISDAVESFEIDRGGVSLSPNTGRWRMRFSAESKRRVRCARWTSKASDSAPTGSSRSLHSSPADSGGPVNSRSVNDAGFNGSTI